MKISNKFPLDKLEEYGFTKPNPEEFGEDTYIQDSEYIYDCGHARRGQRYYILVSKNREVSIYSTKPDGSGGKVSLPRILIYLSIHEILE